MMTQLPDPCDTAVVVVTDVPDAAVPNAVLIFGSVVGTPLNCKMSYARSLDEPLKLSVTIFEALPRQL
jgi:hypothetical protein